jgi:ankyrin repeat protein
LYKLGQDLNSLDKRGCTPLHWACYSRSEIALGYLLALKPIINIQDIEGLTPLHLAVQNIDELESCRHVRALLINGADPNIKNLSDQTPFDMIVDV